ncbi:hypothetical protein HK104_004069 [Borealophlyctis nickersoniae]|nr:hypothetical protein HK104_004069 [Borealophlyctis nickersoniae]
MTEARDHDMEEGELEDEGEILEEAELGGQGQNVDEPKTSFEKAELNHPVSTGELQHDEKWDDSALIEAWDAAVQQYQKHHSGKVTHVGEEKRGQSKTPYTQVKPNFSPYRKQQHRLPANQRLPTIELSKPVPLTRKAASPPNPIAGNPVESHPSVTPGLSAHHPASNPAAGHNCISCGGDMLGGREYRLTLSDFISQY